ncbi:DUF6875 domain-containing protein [Nocardia wallacei]|uniref:DUF6875 domain-containing protein n=1 Tax=Nocardia wallacei TaxID=480035 RepID=UPI0024567D46|nr:hypothetical protein [Nocardia wallacei]
MLRRGELALAPAGETLGRAVSAADRAVLDETEAWLREFLTVPHPDLGRTGPVCPYARPALKTRSLLIAPPSYTTDRTTLVALFRQYRDWYLDILDEQPERDRRLLALVIPLPGFDYTDATELDAVQAHLKQDFVTQGLMVGQFHPASRTPGVRNPAFHPLCSPVPLLALRRMVETDLPFLRDRPSHLEAYLAHLAPALPHTIRRQLAATFL